MMLAVICQVWHGSPLSLVWWVCPLIVCVSPPSSEHRILSRLCYCYFVCTGYTPSYTIQAIHSVREGMLKVDISTRRLARIDVVSLLFKFGSLCS